MAVKIAINGFGRIGRLAFRAMYNQPDFEIVAINSSAGSKTLAHLLKYDSTQGVLSADIKTTDNSIIVDGVEYKVFADRSLESINWGELGVDVVLECTGHLTKKELAEKHIKAGAKKVVISAPAKDDMKTIVYGVNHEILDGSETIISGASCTTNCLAPIVKILDDNFGVEKGYMTTVHAYTNDQRILDGSHKDLRRSRAAAQNIVPTTTGAAVAVGKVLPHLNGKLDGISLRVPTAIGSCVDLVVELNKNVTVEEINNVVKASVSDTVGYTEDPIVSADIVGMHYGTLFDAGMTSLLEVDGKQLVKVLTWYDNEMSYVAQLIRTCKYFATLIK